LELGTGNSSRRGAALILAIVILAALMLLGLPFLFNQSSSLTGTRALAHNQAAHIGEKTAEQLGIAIAADAMSNHLSATTIPPPPPPITPPQPWTSLYDDLNLNYPTPYLVPYFFRDPLPTGLSINRIGLNLSPIAPPAPVPVPVDAAPGLGFNSVAAKDTALLGVSLEDESGKLDPNYLGVAAWKMLLSNVGIPDADGSDIDSDGELATALGNIRSDPAICPSWRIETLDALLKATPAAPRNPLLQAELDLLRPFLTIHSRGQGRSGLIDLGTMLEFDETGNPDDGYLDSLPPTDVLDFPAPPNLRGYGLLVGAGTHLYSHRPGDPGDTVSFGQARNTTLTAISGHAPQPGEAVAIEAPPVVNVNAARPAILRTLNGLASPADIPIVPPSQVPVGISLLDNTAKLLSLTDSPNPIMTNLGITKTGFDYQIPVMSFDEIASSVPQQTQASDGLGPGPFEDASGIPILAGNANVVHLSGGNINDFPPGGYALIVNTATGYRELVRYSWIGSSAINSVSRGNNAADLTLDPVQLAANSIRVIAIGPYELPPLSIASAGVVTVEGAATVTNKLTLSGTASNQQSAQQARRIVAQAVPHEELLEERWTTQADYHALITSRHGSLVAALPRPTNRVEYTAAGLSAVPPNRPVSVTEDAAGTTALDQRNGLRPATLRALTGAGHLSTTATWKMELNGTIANCLETAAGTRMPPSAGYDETDLGTEGLVLDASKRLSYPFNETDRGFFEMDAANPVGTPGANQEIKGRQFSLWVKPTETWSGTVPIFEMRMPIANAGTRFEGTMNPAGSTTDNRVPSADHTLQNYFTLVYDSTAKCLIMRVENGAIEHRVDYGPKSPHETFTVGASVQAPTVDPQCRGTDPGELHPIASAQPWNSIQCRYYLDAAGMETDAWYQIQGVFASNTPGGMAIVVNGMVGRELSRISPLPASLNHGDHLTLPCLFLKQALLARDISATGASGLLESTILIDGYAPGPGGVITSGFNAVSKLLPMRGMIRVGDEYISYNNIITQGPNAQLVNCVRARRQNTNQGSVDATLRWPAVPQHAIGDLVHPGGYRLVPPADPGFTPPRGRLYSGGCTLAGTFGHGLQADDYVIRSKLTTAIDVTPSGIGFTLPATATQLSVVDASQFPDRGIVKIVNELIAYGAKSGNQLTGLTGLESMDVRGPGVPSPVLPRLAISWSAGNEPDVTLISMEVTGANPIDAGRYNQSNVTYLQIMDPVNHRVEWISYTHIVDNRSGLYYFLNDRGFAATGERARERTEFDPSQAFPIGSRVLPVQTEVDSPWFISTGDVLTIAPKVVDVAAGRRPTQACVRYAATDGFSTTINPLPATGDTWDTHNGYFAFTEELPLSFAPGEYELLCWPCWSANDISPLNPVSATTTLPKFLLPWGNAFATDFLVDSNDRLLFIGGDDDRAAFNSAPNADAMGGVIDAGQASQQDGFWPTNQSVVTAWTPNPAPDDTMAAVTAGLRVVSGIALFPSNRTYGLVLIGGEVFAYQRVDGQTGTIIGRGLLGSHMVPHSANEPILVLPLGPVSTFTSTPAGPTLSPNHQGSVNLSGGLNAPAILFCSPDGSSFEFIGLPNRKTAPWLRGMYNTEVNPSWGPSSGLSPLAIGWWPRYASALPGDLSDGWTNCSSDQQSALMRCRSYAWAGFPIRFYECFFDSRSRLADVFLLSLPNHGGSQLFNLEARALRLGFAWSTQPPVLIDNVGSYNDVSLAFVNKAAGPDDEQFISTTTSLPIATDGAELRVMWRYREASYTKLADTAGAANKAPMLGSVHVRCLAPSKILKVETAR
jgi:hypothetical protein